jgi:3-oxoacyl-[acyl-carrier protein] reductase
MEQKLIHCAGCGGPHAKAFHRVPVATALVGFTRAPTVELGEHGVTAILVVPRRVGGTRSKTSGAGDAFLGGSWLPIGHEGAPPNVAEIVRTLALPAGDFITGQTIHVSDGIWPDSARLASAPPSW